VINFKTKLPKVNNRPIGENSTNLATLNPGEVQEPILNTITEFLFHCSTDFVISWCFYRVEETVKIYKAPSNLVR
jgi:hypothetical protein